MFADVGMYGLASAEAAETERRQVTDLLNRQMPIWLATSAASFSMPPRIMVFTGSPVFADCFALT